MPLISLKKIRNLSAMMALSFTIALQAAPAQADQGFVNWINQFYATAAKSGISKSTYQKAFAGVRAPDPAADDVAQDRRP